MRGPFGTGLRRSSRLPRTLLVGGGYGAAPLHFLARRLLARPNAPARRIHAVLGARTAADLLFADRFAGLGVAVHPATEDGSAGGRRGRATDVVAAAARAGRRGPPLRLRARGMLEALAALCPGRAACPAELSHEAYMRCGVGVCGSCEHGDRLVCMDGPVFEVTP